MIWPPWKLRHREHAVVEDRVRALKSTGLSNLPFSAFARQPGVAGSRARRARPHRLDPAAALRRRPRRLRAQAAALPAAARRRAPDPPRPPPHAAPPGRLALGRRDRPSLQAPRRAARLTASRAPITTIAQPRDQRAITACHRRARRPHHRPPRPPERTPHRRPRARDTPLNNRSHRARTSNAHRDALPTNRG